MPTDKTVSKERLQDQITEEVTEQSGAAPDSVNCPGDLAAVVGATLDCTLVDRREQRRVSVTVGSADGDQVDLYIVQSIGKEHRRRSRSPSRSAAGSVALRSR